MASSIKALTLFTPVIASSTVFAARRAGKGIDYMDDNPFFGTANLIIAGGQTLKGIRAAKDLSITTTPSAAESIKEINSKAKNLSESSKCLKGIGKVFDFTSRHINPLICLASFIKVLGSDDKADTGVREILGLSTMFASENIAKSILGMPYTKINSAGQPITVPREALYHKNPFAEKQIKAFEDYCSTKKLFNKISLKSAPGAIKGTLFVLASIFGYKLGGVIANLLIGKEGQNHVTPKSANEASIQTSKLANAV